MIHQNACRNEPKLNQTCQMELCRSSWMDETLWNILWSQSEIFKSRKVVYETI